MDGPRHVIEQAARAHNNNESIVGLDEMHPIQQALRDVIWCGVALMISERDRKWMTAR